MPGQSCDAMRCSIQREHGLHVLRACRRACTPPRPAGCRSLSRSRSGGSSMRTWAMRKNRSLRKRPAFISAPRSRRVAARTRTSIGSNALPPTRLTCLSLSARRSFGCSSSGSSPSSSRKSVPPSASASAPLRRSARPREGPLLVPEEDALGQGRRDAPAVDHDERRPSCGRSRRGSPWPPAPCRCPSRRGSARYSGVLDTFSSTLKTRRIFGRAAHERPEAVGEPDLDPPLGLRLEEQPRAPRPSARWAWRRRPRARAPAPRKVPLVLPRSRTRMPSLTARSSQWNALTS